MWSVFHLVYFNFLVTFFPCWCILQDLMTRMTIGLGKQRDMLYYLVSIRVKNPKHKLKSVAAITTNSLCSLATSSTHLWHCRLGHLCFFRLDFMAKKLLNFPFQFNNTCKVCALAKQTRLSFSTSSISSLKHFELIHCDICGPFQDSLSL